jgi:hypothetical protein
MAREQDMKQTRKKHGAAFILVERLHVKGESAGETFVSNALHLLE